jgi:hypothetical protein
MHATATQLVTPTAVAARGPSRRPAAAVAATSRPLATLTEPPESAITVQKMTQVPATKTTLASRTRPRRARRRTTSRSTARTRRIRLEAAFLSKTKATPRAASASGTSIPRRIEPSAFAAMLLDSSFGKTGEASLRARLVRPRLIKEAPAGEG